jgi:FixH.
MYRPIFFITIALALFAFGCGSGGGTASSGKVIKSGPAGNNLTVSVSNSDGVLKKGKQTFTVTFADASGKPVDVGAASVNFFMPAMGSMSAMNTPVALTTTATPGVYSGTADIEMSGEWQAQVKYEGPAGKGNATLPITAQ